MLGPGQVLLRPVQAVMLRALQWPAACGVAGTQSVWPVLPPVAPTQVSEAAMVAVWTCLPWLAVSDVLAKPLIVSNVQCGMLMAALFLILTRLAAPGAPALP